MYEALKKAQAEIRVAQCRITNNDELYAKLDEMIMSWKTWLRLSWINKLPSTGRAAPNGVAQSRQQPTREEMMSEFEKIVTVTPAFDKRHPDPSKNYGIGACRIWFILKGPKGAVQFQIGTDWYLPEQQKEFRGKPPIYDIQPQGWDVGYHSYKPMYEGQAPMGECDVLGCECYYDGSSLMADEWVPDFLAGGTEWLWKKLEEEYRELFDPTGSPTV